jgi:Cu-Zn family superoxide dismutase
LRRKTIAVKPFKEFAMRSLFPWGVLAVVVLALAPAAAQERKKARQLEEHVDPPTRGVAMLYPTEGSRVEGVIAFEEGSDGVRLRGRVTGLTPGLHGFHIHEFGDLSDPKGESAGGHFNPHGHRHGGPDDEERHAGDLGNIKANEQGVAEVDIRARGLKLHFVIGRALVVHAGEDDFKTQPTGDAGARAAVGVIGIAKSVGGERRAAN